jgi:hypothetical protein
MILLLLLTVFIYLNTLPKEEGGETNFPYLGLKIRPVKGLVIFRPKFHDFCTVLSHHVHVFSKFQRQRMLFFLVICFSLVHESLTARLIQSHS